MKKSKKRLIGILMSMCILLMMPTTIFASDKPNGFDAEKYVAEELNNWAKENGIGVAFENIHIEPINCNIGEAEIEESVESYVKMMKSAMKNMDVNVVYHPNMARATGSYTASVESLIPAIGWGYINQDFTASVSSSRISRVTLKGNSYDTGFTLGTWEPNN